MKVPNRAQESRSSIAVPVNGPMTYERVLIASDLSDGAVGAVRAAKRVASPDARYGVACIVSPPLQSPYTAPLDLDLAPIVRWTQDKAAEWAERAGIQGSEIMVRVGSVTREVAQAADEMSADLVAVGQTGTSRFTRWLMGSTARSVLHATPTDVIVGRERTSERINHVLVATDFHPPSEAAARRARDIAEASGAAVTLAHVLDYDMWTWATHEAQAPPVFDMAEMERRTLAALHKFNDQHFDGKAKVAMRKGRAAKELLDLIEQSQADLVVLGTRGAGAVERVLIGSVAERTAEASPAPVLVVRG